MRNEPGAKTSSPPRGAETWQVRALPGGLRVVVESIPYVRSVSVGVWVAVGSRHESAELAGTSHLVEHLLFKGTERRSARQLAEEVDSIGGHLNGYTSKEYSCYYVKVLDTHLEKAVDLISDLVLAPRFNPEDLGREKGVILEEIKMYEDTPDELAGDLLSEAVWGADPLGRPILGSVDSVSAASVETVKDYHAAGYRQAATVVALAGNIRTDDGFRLAKDYFGPMGSEGEREPLPAPAFRPGYRERTKTVEQAHVCVGFDGVRLGDPAVWASHLLAAILGGGASSRLFQSIREERGLAYSVFAYTAPFSDTGLFGVYAGVSPDNLPEVLRLIGTQCRDLASRGPTSEELQRAKDQFKASMLLGLESTSHRMGRLGRSLLLRGNILGPDELVRRVDAVGAGDLAEMARRMFRPEAAGLALVGPDGSPGEETLRSALAEGLGS